MRLSDPHTASDLHAADARYHNDWRLKFMPERNVLYASRKTSDQDLASVDEAYETVKNLLDNDRKSMWTSIEVEKIYQKHGGFLLSRQCLIGQLTKDFTNELTMLSSPGLVNVLVFWKHASNIMKITESDDQPTDVSKAAKCIRKEISNLVLNKDEYEQRTDKAAAKECVSETLRALLSQISDDLSANELPAILIGKIIISVVRKKPTSLLIDLALIVREKKLIEHLYNYTVACSYDEVKRFKAQQMWRILKTLL